MKKIFILFFLVGLAFGQAKYFLPLPIESSNGRPIKNATILVVPTATTSGYIAMTWLSSGYYYYTGGAATVADGAYDIVIVIGTDTTVWRSNIYIANNDAATLTAQWRSDISDSIAVAAVVVDSSSIATPGYIYYGGQSTLTERWGSTGYIITGTRDTLVFPKPFETAILGIFLQPYSNVDSTGYKWHVTSALKDTVFLEFFGTDSATFFYRAIGY